MSKVRTIFVVSSVVLLLAMAVTAVPAQAASLVIGSQKLFQGDGVIVTSATIEGPGFIAIYNSSGKLVGLQKVPAGTTRNAMIRLHIRDITSSLTALLYLDQGVVGKFEPGVDIPVAEVSFEVRGAREAGGAVAAATSGPTGAVTTPTTAPQVLPPTGGTPMPWISVVLLAAGSLSLVAGIGMSLVRRKR